MRNMPNLVVWCGSGKMSRCNNNLEPALHLLAEWATPAAPVVDAQNPPAKHSSRDNKDIAYGIISFYFTQEYFQPCFRFIRPYRTETSLFFCQPSRGMFQQSSLFPPVFSKHLYAPIFILFTQTVGYRSGTWIWKFRFSCF